MTANGVLHTRAEQPWPQTVLDQQSGLQTVHYEQLAAQTVHRKQFGRQAVRDGLSRNLHGARQKLFPAGF